MITVIPLTITAKNQTMFSCSIGKKLTRKNHLIFARGQLMCFGEDYMVYDDLIAFNPYNKFNFIPEEDKNCLFGTSTIFIRYEEANEK